MRALGRQAPPSSGAWNEPATIDTPHACSSEDHRRRPHHARRRSEREQAGTERHMTQAFGDQQAVVEQQFRLYQASPVSVPEEWRAFFAGLSTSHLEALRAATAPREAAPAPPADLMWKLAQLMEEYRSRGHYTARIDPLELAEREAVEFDPRRFGLTDADLELEVPTRIPGVGAATGRELIAHLERTYCGSVGFEFMHVEDSEERAWLLERIETGFLTEDVSAEDRATALQHLTDAQELERFLHTHYVGAKRFSLEGLEPVIPMLHTMLERAAELGVRDTIVGMAHRGRLNVLINLLDKRHEDLFRMFNDADSESLVGRGDVKYHLGYRTERALGGGARMQVALCFNPSHLEFVAPVVSGRARAIADHRSDGGASAVLPITIHGDAAIAGQGIVMETLNLAGLEGYRHAGAVRIVLNNQVGFTTSPSDARSCRYASDIVRFMRVPVFHVNCEDIEAVLRVARLAIDYRQRFGRDVCIDLVGYRRYGHNEGDEPRFTQPAMYGRIDARPSVRDEYAALLARDGVVSAETAEQWVADRRQNMAAALAASKQHTENPLPRRDEAQWAAYDGGPELSARDASTAVDEPSLRRVLRAMTSIPASFDAHPKVRRVYEQRAQAFERPGGIDWGTAELLAYGTLVAEGHPVRMTGQDCRRGTFSHRHAELVDNTTGERWSCLSNLASGTSRFEVYDSPLSEAAVLGFEYGYSLEQPNALVLWEAQFGDFVNGAQVIVDQFIAAGEDKWNRLTGLTMLLPHGFEGQGPEHSYARLGRFLQLCAEDNMVVADCTTPAQFYHLLRRQVLRPLRKPLVVMSPKSLLRHKKCVSSLEDLTHGGFQRILPDTSGTPDHGVRRVLLCSGRLYYDLETERERRSASDIHIHRLEQLYPLDADGIRALLTRYPAGTQLYWVQDEPWNMGAWFFLHARLTALFGSHLPLSCVARAESASPATGSNAAHRLESQTLLEAAFAP
jgi:2-oxoglutarate dehydrogenase E1 component